MVALGIGYFRAEPWTIETIGIDDDGLRVSGWVLPPLAGLPARFTWNDRPFDAVEFPIARDDVGRHFLTRAYSAASGFACRVRASRAEIFEREFLRIEYGFHGRPKPFAAANAWFFGDPDRDPPLPETERLVRVIGRDDSFQFRLGGATDFKRICAIAARHGAPIGPGNRILDWGVGCGRVARYLQRVEGVEVHGADIDADNADWCARNLRGEYRSVPLMPPTDYPDGHFDLVYGVSVFTHLSQLAQDAWLRELARITRPGGTVIVTTHGETAIEYGGGGLEANALRKERLRKEGFLVTSANDQIAAAIGNSDYYLNVDHAPWYVRRHWGRFLEVVAMIPGAIGVHDVVVLRNSRTSIQ
ncbi:hypothetical protein DSM104443_01007 [Usitatibacter rugosus]|uniref:Methyltransferase domain-containing protein n=2 Tax=Usitatibacter rugosus TaxID=2732067 RepID=A0A6M4GS90_9PROT|nr:hypothetical protein DSM104443_01007 [Usitatibacter rugosus]